jgi:hypothetical protein
MELWDGFRWRDKYQRTLYAVHAQTIMSAQAKKPIKPFKAFRLEINNGKKKTTKEESQKELDEMIKRMRGEK